MAREYEWIRDENAPSAIAPTSLGPHSISACLVVRNEERLIPRCLASLTGVVDEILVVHDGECGDRTLDIAAASGARIFVREWYGHPEHHLPFAYEQARGEWLLTIDADEFLSGDLRKALRELAVADVDGYEFLWKIWNGVEYITDRGPFKFALARRRALHMIGVQHNKGEVDGAVRRMQLHLEHRPSYDALALSTILKRWAPRSRLQAREYLSPLDTSPRFNCPGTVRWTDRREWVTRWAAWMVVPAALHTWQFVWRDSAGQMPIKSRMRFAASQALSRAIVTAQIVTERRRKSRSS